MGTFATLGRGPEPNTGQYGPKGRVSMYKDQIGVPIGIPTDY